MRAGACPVFLLKNIFFLWLLLFIFQAFVNKSEQQNSLCKTDAGQCNVMCITLNITMHLHTHSYTQRHSHSDIHTLHTHTHTHTQMLSQTHTHSHTDAHTQTHTHSHPIVSCAFTLCRTFLHSTLQSLGEQELSTEFFSPAL